MTNLKECLNDEGRVKHSHRSYFKIMCVKDYKFFKKHNIKSFLGDFDYQDDIFNYRNYFKNDLLDLYKKANDELKEEIEERFSSWEYLGRASFDNFFTETKVNYQNLENIKEKSFVQISTGKKLTPKELITEDIDKDFSSFSGSAYIYLRDEEGEEFVARFSNHWGDVASCLWFIDKRKKPFDWAIANLKDFKQI